MKTKYILFFVVTLGCLYIATRDVVWERLWALGVEAKWRYVLAALVFLSASYRLRAARWHYLFPSEVRSRSLHHLFPVMMIGYFGNNILPARGGEVARVILAGRQNGISRAGTVSTIVAERTLDGLLLSLIGLLAIHQIPFDHMQWIKQIGLVFAGIFLLILVLGLRRASVKRLLTLISLKAPGRLPGLVTEVVLSMLDYLESITTTRGFLRIALFTVMIWTLEVAVYTFVGASFAIWLQPFQLGIFITAVNFASLAPISPGGVGTIELVGTEALVFSGLGRETALAIVLTQHALQYLFCFGFGIYYIRRFGFSLSGLLPGDGRRQSWMFKF